MDDITFNHYEFSSDDSNPFKALRRSGLLASGASKVIQIAFDHGAYVAGGFARQVISTAIDVEFVFKTPDCSRILRYLGHPNVLPNGQPNSTFWKAGCGDIDVFFPDVASLHRFWSDIERSLPNSNSVVRMSATATPNACELLCDGNVVVQIITGFYAPIEEQLKAFDFFNAMVAFNDKEAIVPEHWHELDKANVLHIVRCTSIFTPHRVNKWFRKHGYKHLTPASSAMLTAHVLELVSKLKQSPHVPRNGIAITDLQIIGKMKYILPSLSNDDLLALVSFYPVDQYDSAFDLLRKRADKEHHEREKASV